MSSDEHLKTEFGQKQPPVCQKKTMNINIGSIVKKKSRNRWIDNILLHKCIFPTCEFHLYVKQCDFFYYSIFEYDHFFVYMLPERANDYYQMANFYDLLQKNRQNQDIKHDVVIIFQIVVVCAYFWSFSLQQYGIYWHLRWMMINLSMTAKKEGAHITHHTWFISCSTSFSNSYVRRQQQKIAHSWVAYTYDTHVWIAHNLFAQCIDKQKTVSHCLVFGIRLLRFQFVDSTL